jgi:late competence protein required for DNA uptake (superfamily II DNA/RNA helicase)
MRELTVNRLHMAITDADWTLLKGRSGAKLTEKLPAIVAALARRLCIACQRCGTAITEETAYSIMDSTICRGCFDAHRERRRVADDSCVPTAPFEGDGGRVVRSTKGL